ncbi:hypothetical protein SNE40_001988 [Patella caerulea]|uniref:Uncharacterized protein n=1 Tax=Patella caerulea TaxID=87958 RepID=A0AAN8K0A6_PATCE
MTSATGLVKSARVFDGYSSLTNLSMENGGDDFLSSTGRLADSKVSNYNQHSIDGILGTKRHPEIERGKLATFLTFLVPGTRRVDFRFKTRVYIRDWLT